MTVSEATLEQMWVLFTLGKREYVESTAGEKPGVHRTEPQYRKECEMAGLRKMLAYVRVG